MDILIEKYRGTRGAVVLLIGILHVSFEYRSVMTTLKSLYDLVFGNSPKISVTTNYSGPWAEKRRKCFWNFVKVPCVFALDWKSLMVSDTPFEMNNQ